MENGIIDIDGYVVKSKDGTLKNVSAESLQGFTANGKDIHNPDGTFFAEVVGFCKIGGKQYLFKSPE